MSVAKIHEMSPEVFALVPYISLVLNGDYTGIINPKDEIRTKVVSYRVDSLAYNGLMDKTICVVREIVP
jgi:hypothetical protein